MGSRKGIDRGPWGLIKSALVGVHIHIQHETRYVQVVISRFTTGGFQFQGQKVIVDSF